NPDDAKLLGVIARGRINQAQKTGGLNKDQNLQSSLTIRSLQARDFTSAYRHAVRFLVLMQGGKMDEGVELATSYQFKLDRRILAPGEFLGISLQPIFTLGQDLSGTYTIKLTLKSASNEALKTLEPISIREVADREISLPTQELKPGNYFLHYEL